MPPFFASRFERVFYEGRFVGQFEQEAKDFVLLVSDPNNDHNWASGLLVNETADSLNGTPLVQFLQDILTAEEKPLRQGDDAAAAAGLKVMNMGFGGDASPEMTVGTPGEKKKKKKKKKKAKKEEL